MSIKSRKAVSAALVALQEDVDQLQRNDTRQEKILTSHSEEIAALQKCVSDMRNAAIAAEANNRVPYSDISKRYGGLSKSRISQIKKQFTDK